MSDDESEDEGPFDAADIELAVEDDEGETTIIEDIESVDVELDEGAHPEFSIAGESGEMEFSGSFEVEVDEENLELFETLIAGKAFESGMSKELADELDEIISDDSDVGGVPPPEKFLEELEGSPDVVDELTVDAEQAETLLKVVYQKMNEYQTETGQLPDRLVLGLPQFKAIEAYTQESKNQSVEAALPVDEVIVVPGPQIHCVKDPYAMVEASLEDTDEDST